jgi:hypothetical protein
VNNRLAMMLTYYSFPSERKVILESGARYLLRTHPEATAVEARVGGRGYPPLRDCRHARHAGRVDRARRG